ncbi:unnamed protein product [Caenorhabditis bovis]|uniref:Nephrocystin-4 n=1 Tax=Caenorhabditis bovis TaxID=2654633 RepID=A0A8S1E8G5_9PELO|nr:unnamed protein product [Caenorhabditis bovis]
MSSANEWYISFLENRGVEIKRSITAGTISDGYAVRIGRLFSNELLDGVEYRINAFFYDLATSQMFGRPCNTKWTYAKEKRCEFFEELYFHCPTVDDKILLILQFVEKEKSEISPFVAPLKEPLISASLDEISIFFGQNAKKIEDTIIDEILRDRHLKDNLPPKTFTRASVVDRRLKIGVHNGFCYLSEPLCISLTATNTNLVSNNSTIKKRRAMSSTDLIAGPVAMYINSRVSIPNLIEDPRIALILMVEYTFLYDDDKRVTHPILIGWGAWKPFATSMERQQYAHATVSLIGGPRPNPEGVLCFRNLLHLQRSMDNAYTESHPHMTIEFTFFVDQLDFESRVPTSCDNHSILDRRTPKSERSSKSQKLASKTDLDENKDEGEKLPQIETARSHTSEEELFAINEDLNKIIPPPKVDDDLLKDDSKSSSVYMIPFEATKPSNFPRSVHSMFARLNFQPLRDRTGAIPSTEDVNEKILMDVNREKNDRLDVSHFFFQFIAVKKLVTKGHHPNLAKLFFTIQFYRFHELSTETLLLATDEKYEPSILKRIDKNGEPIGGSPGFIAKFIIEGDDEKRDFVDYLASGNAIIDAWDAESLCHVGTSIIPLKNLLRRGREAIQLYLQCPIVDSSNKHNCLLYIRLANIGHPAAHVYGLQQQHPQPHPQHPQPPCLFTLVLSFKVSMAVVNGVVVSSEFCSFLSENASIASNSCSVARRLTSTNKLAGEEGPHSYRVQAKPLNTLHKSQLDRFLTAQRLDIQQRHEEIFNSSSLDKLKQWNKLKNDFPFDNKKISQKFIFEEELAAYRKLRYESKPAKLLEAVFKGITVRHEIHPSFGEKVFFEFPLENTLSEPINCVVEIDDQALRPVLDQDEWAFYKTLNKIQTPIEKNMIRETSDKIEVFLKPGETVFIPFVYDSFFFANDHFDMYSTKIIFRRWDNRDPISILDLHVYHRNYLPNHSVVFIGESNSSLQKQLVLPTLSKDRRVISCRCSNPEVRVGLKNASLKQIAHFTTFVGDVGSRSTFLILMYSDHYQFRLVAVWKITILSYHRVDLRGIVGQSSRAQLSIQQQYRWDSVYSQI